MEELITLWTALLIVVTLVTYLAQRIALAEPVLLVLAGLVISLVPHVPHVILSPELVLNVVLPLLIYTGAVVVPWHDFRRNLRPIGILSIGLVGFTTCGVALLAHFLIPGMSWAPALVLGAVISPPDDVAVAIVTRRLSIPRRLLVVLEGEGLVNDVTALTIFRFALIAAAGGTVSMWTISLSFLATLAGGILYGLLVGWLALKLRQKMHDTQLEITVSLITPFVAYLVPEHFGVTGILSTVAAGVFISAQSPKGISPQTRLEAHQLWVIISFWMNNMLFLVLGLQLKSVTAEVADIALSQLAVYGALFTALVIALRFIWVYAAAYLSRWLSPSLRKTDPIPPSRHLFLVAYSGMRGAISMAAVLSIPLTSPNGQEFPHRNLIVFVTFFVILATLVGQGLLLPLVVRKLCIGEDGDREQQQDSLGELRARIAASEAGIARLHTLEREGVFPREIIEALLRERESYGREVAFHLGGQRDAELRKIALMGLEARKIEISAEREKLLEMLRGGEINEYVLIRIEHDLDLRAARLEDYALSLANP